MNSNNLKLKDKGLGNQKKERNPYTDSLVI